jgi:translation initiation factor 5
MKSLTKSTSSPPLHSSSSIIPFYESSDFFSSSSLFSTSTIPIISSSSSSFDPFYRYQMPLLSSEILPKHQTLLHNLPEVARALNRESIEILKFFSLQTSTRFHSSSPSSSSSSSVADHPRHRSQYILTGRYSSNELQQLLSQYLEIFILCPHCSLPETFYKIKIAAAAAGTGTKSTGKVSLACQACGMRSECDRDHKLTSFILKQFQKMKSLREKESNSRTLLGTAARGLTSCHNVDGCHDHDDAWDGDSFGKTKKERKKKKKIKT